MAITGRNQKTLDAAVAELGHGLLAIQAESGCSDHSEWFRSYAVLGVPGYSAYAATKAGVRAMTRNLASELAPRGIRVNQLTPGGTKTPIWSPQAPTEEAMAALEERLAGMTALGRMGEAEEIAQAASYLASNEASFVTGTRNRRRWRRDRSPYRCAGLSHVSKRMINCTRVLAKLFDSAQVRRRMEYGQHRQASLRRSRNSRGSVR